VLIQPARRLRLCVNQDALQATDLAEQPLEDHIRPAAKRAGITKRIAWHTLRHTYGTLLKANGEDVATVQALMRHANVSVTMNTYVQAVTPAKRKAQRGIIKQIREVAPDGPRSKSEMPASA
jgi:site-specific recombinase XerD